MSTNEIRDTVNQAIFKVCKIDPATYGDDVSFRDDLGLDSLAFLETVVEVQYRFRIPEVSDEEYAAVRTIGDAVELVRRYLPAGVA